MDLIDTSLKTLRSTRPTDARVEYQTKLKLIDELVGNSDPRVLAGFLDILRSRRVSWDALRLPILKVLQTQAYSEEDYQRIGRTLVEILDADKDNDSVRHAIVTVLRRYRDTPGALEAAQAIVLNVNRHERILTRYAALGMLTDLGTVDDAVIAQLIAQYDIQQSTDKRSYEYAGKIAIVEELAVLESHPAVIRFYLQVVTEPLEYDLARVEILKRLMYMEVSVEDAQRIGSAIVAIIAERADNYLVRQWAATAWGAYPDIKGAVEVVTPILLDPNEDVNVRHNILGALEQLGPTPQVVAIARQLATDLDFATYMPRIFANWNLPE